MSLALVCSLLHVLTASQLTKTTSGLNDARKNLLSLLTQLSFSVRITFSSFWSFVCFSKRPFSLISSKFFHSLVSSCLFLFYLLSAIFLDKRSKSKLEIPEMPWTFAPKCQKLYLNKICPNNFHPKNYFNYQKTLQMQIMMMISIFSHSLWDCYRIFLML